MSAIFKKKDEYIFASDPTMAANKIDHEQMRAMLNEQDSARTQLKNLEMADSGDRNGATTTSSRKTDDKKQTP